MDPGTATRVPSAGARRHRRAGTAVALGLAGLLPLAPAPSAHGDLVVNEVVTRNQAGLTDELGRRPDWIELYNPGALPQDLAGWSLSDDVRRPRRWTFLGGSLAPGAFLVVYASGDDRQPIPAPPLDPGAIPGIAVWLRADTIRAGDSSQVRRSGGADYVVRWPDVSGRGRDARQAEAARQPRWIAGDRPVVRFDGVDDLLRLAQPPGTNRFTAAVVVRPSLAHEQDEASTAGVGGVSGQRWLFGAAHGGDRGAGAGLSVGTNGASAYEHGSGYMPARVVQHAALAGRFAVITLVYSNRAPLLALNGVPSPVAPVSPRDPVTAPTELGAGAYGAFAGEVAEVMLFDRALADEERRGLEEALARRHDVALARVYHTNFRLDGDGERLMLTTPAGAPASDLRVPTLPRDISWGRPGDAGGSFAFFAEPTPGAPNPAAGALLFLAPPRFSTPAGFLTGATELTLTAPDAGATIRYTLDGSEPGEDSPRYLGPIALTNRSTLPNRLSAIPTAPGWQPPVARVFKGTVVRARAFRAEAIPSDTVTASYFIHPRGRGRYTLPVVSLATDERHFFDPDTGIYVPGNAPGGNYAQSGDAWERPVHVEFFETNGTRAFAQESGVRMHGNTSFGFPLKALRLHPENQRGTGPFRYRIFPDLPIETFHRLLLRPSGHDYGLTMMRDGLMQGMVRELGLDLQGYRPAIVFLNGEYWGIHNLQEAFEKHYFASHHPGVDADAVDYLEGYAPGAYAYEGDPDSYHELVRRLEGSSAREPATWDWVTTRMDPANYRDYKLAEIFYYRWDIGNHRLWRPRSDDGRLRWILFDCDVGFGGFWSEPQPWTFNMLRAALEPSGSLHGHNNATTVFLLQSLLGNPGFRADFINRAADLMNGPLSTPRMLAAIDRMAAEISPEIVEHLGRWRAPATVFDWSVNVEALRTFARERPRHMREHLSAQFQLGGTARLRLAAPAPGGRIRVNSLTPDPAPGTEWEGVYFRNQPITLEARPDPGWAFAGWSGLPAATGATVTLALPGDTAVGAVFVAAGPLRLTTARPGPDGRLPVQVAGPPGTAIHIESSGDLRGWETIAVLGLDATGGATWLWAPSSDAVFLRVRLSP